MIAYILRLIFKEVKKIKRFQHMYIKSLGAF